VRVDKIEFSPSDVARALARQYGKELAFVDGMTVKRARSDLLRTIQELPSGAGQLSDSRPS